MQNIFENMMKFVQQTNKLLQDGLTFDDLPQELKDRFQNFFKPFEELDTKVKEVGQALEDFGQTVVHFGERLTAIENQLKALAKSSKKTEK